MPGLDGTGPRGIGPMTGGGRGLCGPGGIGRTAPAWHWFGFGRGGGMGRGVRWRSVHPGMGWGLGCAGTAAYPRAMSREEERGFLRGEAEAIKQELSEIEARIQQVEKDEA